MVLYAQRSRLTARGRQLLGERREDRAKLSQPVQKLLALNPTGSDTPTAQQSTALIAGSGDTDGMALVAGTVSILPACVLIRGPSSPRPPHRRIRCSHLEHSVLTTEDYRGQH
jgi:hypothetical protein